MSTKFPSNCFAKSKSVIPDGQRSNKSLINSSVHTKVFKSDIVFNPSAYPVVIKIFYSRSAGDFFTGLFRATRAKRAFKADNMLLKNGFKAPVPIVLGEKSNALAKTGSFLVSSEIAESRPFYEAVEELAQKDISKKRHLIVSFAETVGQMHQKNIFHGDLRLGNILVQENEGEFVFTLLDNERTKKLVRPSEHLRIKNLVQIGMCKKGISRTDRMRFFRQYLKSCKNIGMDEKKLALIAWDKTLQRLAKKNVRIA